MLELWRAVNYALIILLFLSELLDGVEGFVVYKFKIILKKV
jgi:hypothetical protein